MPAVGALYLTGRLRLVERTASNPQNPQEPPTPPSGPFRSATGLCCRQGVPADVSWARTEVKGVVHDVSWSALQDAVNGPLLSSGITNVENALASATALGMWTKLRIFAGTRAPAPVKAIGGTPVSIFDPVDGKTGTVGRWWLPDYQAAYADLIAKVAARWNDDTRLVDVPVAGCSTVYAEPCIHQLADDPTREALYAAGLTLEKDVAAQKLSIEAHKPLTSIATSFAFNPLQWPRPLRPGEAPDADCATCVTKFADSIENTLLLMDYGKSILGKRWSPGNNSYREGGLGAKYDQMYAKMKALGGGYIQTAAANQPPGTPAGCWKWGCDLNALCLEITDPARPQGPAAQMIELPGQSSHFTPEMTAAQAAAINQRCTDNAAAYLAA